MKSTLTFLTLLAVFALAPQSSFGQYAWVPVIAPEAANAPHPQSMYSTHVGSAVDQPEAFASFGGDADCEADCDCPTCRHDGLLERAFVGVEYLQWWNKGRTLPALVTGGNPTTTTFSAAGVLPGAPILFGGREVGDDLKAGARLTGGLWFDDCKTTGAVVRAFGTEGDSTRFQESSLGNPILAVPFNDRSAALFGQENALVLAYSGGLTAGIDAQGSVDAHAANDIWGGDAFIRTMVDEGCDYRLDLIGGYQFTRIDDDLTLDTTLTRFDIAGSPSFTTSDLFNVANEYHAGLVGVMGEVVYDRLTLQLMGKVGVGNMHQTVAISGDYSVTSGGTTTGPGGIFAQTTPPGGGPDFNIGTYERDLLVWSPEASIKAIYCVNNRLSISVGYSFLYWTRVALAGDQIDRQVNRDVLFGGAFQPGGGDNPTFAFRDTDFWVQTIDIGATLNY